MILAEVLASNANHGSSNGVVTQCARSSMEQGVTKIKPSGKRAFVPIEYLTDENIEQLIQQLKGQSVGEFEIALYRESEDELRERAIKKLAQRQQVTGKFNVRSRAVAASGIVVSNDPRVLDLAHANDLLAATVDAPWEKSLKTHSIDTEGWKVLLDQSIGELKVQFYGTANELRGPRGNAAAHRERAGGLPRPRDTTVSSELLVTGPCKRGDESTGRDAAMSGFSALNYAKAVGVAGAEEHTWEWLHLVGSSLGGANEEGNLVAGTFDSNTIMIPIEQAIVAYSNREDVTPEKPVKIVAQAEVVENTWVAEEIFIEVFHGNKTVMSFGPFSALKTGKLTTMEYDLYAYVFNRMASSK
jgi:hypothetical protein